VIGGDGAREGSKEGASRGVCVEDAKVCKNKSDSYLRDRMGCTNVEQGATQRFEGMSPVPSVWKTSLRIVPM
jgi:hypothetical protein